MYENKIVSDFLSQHMWYNWLSRQNVNFALSDKILAPNVAFNYFIYHEKERFVRLDFRAGVLWTSILKLTFFPRLYSLSA